MLFISILSLLVSNSVAFRRDVSILFNRVSMTALFSSFILVGMDYSNSIFLKSLGLHGGLLDISNINQIFHMFLFIISILILTLTSFYPAGKPKDAIPDESFKYNFLKRLYYYRTVILNKEPFKIIEYPLIILFVLIGALFLISAKDLVSIFLSIELQSYGLYILSTIYRNSELSTTGGLIYFLLGGLSSSFILLGTGLLYVNTGTTSMDGIYILNSLENVNNNVYSWYGSGYINLALLLFITGFLFKVSAAPFHFWAPDVYDSLPTVVTTFVAITGKLSIFIFLLEIIYHTNINSSLFAQSADKSPIFLPLPQPLNWTLGLLISCLLCFIIGTIGGLTQFRIKRLLAYSTITHSGFLILALSVCSIESTQAFIFYLTQYSLSNLNAFILLIVIGFSISELTSNNQQYTSLLDKSNSPVQLISQLKGYFYLNPTVCLSLAITVFSFIGIPPLVGFFGKQMVLSAALDKSFIFLALIGILTSAIGAVYYLNIIKEIFFDSSEYTHNPAFINISSKYNTFYIKELYTDNRNICLSNPLAITIAGLTLIILLFINFNREWLGVGTILVQILFNS